ncbi:hypothetical protein HK096_002615, partial [Nowakowskiella sp. JEL0078]
MPSGNIVNKYELKNMTRLSQTKTKKPFSSAATPELKSRNSKLDYPNLNNESKLMQETSPSNRNNSLSIISLLPATLVQDSFDMSATIYTIPLNLIIQYLPISEKILLDSDHNSNIAYIAVMKTTKKINAEVSSNSEQYHSGADLQKKISSVPKVPTRHKQQTKIHETLHVSNLSKTTCVVRSDLKNQSMQIKLP